MARHGENIRKRKDGRWEGRYPVYSEKKERRVYCSVYGRTYDEVREKLTIKKNLVKGHPETVEREDSQKIHILKSISFSEAAQDWLEQVRKKRKLSTYIYRHFIFQ